MRFEFAFDHRYERPLSLLGIRPSTCDVTVESGGITARFGPWRLETPVANVAGVEITGPYQAIRAIGARLSFADRGVTFGTNTERGVCVRFARPVGALMPGPLLRHPGATFTLADCQGFAAEVERSRTAGG